MEIRKEDNEKERKEVTGEEKKEGTVDKRKEDTEGRQRIIDGRGKTTLRGEKRWH